MLNKEVGIIPLALVIDNNMLEFERFIQFIALKDLLEINIFFERIDVYDSISFLMFLGIVLAFLKVEKVALADLEEKLLNLQPALKALPKKFMPQININFENKVLFYFNEKI